VTRAEQLAALLLERYGDPETLAAEAWTPTPSLERMLGAGERRDGNRPTSRA